jgi:hypothetical protein
MSSVVLVALGLIAFAAAAPTTAPAETKSLVQFGDNAAIGKTVTVTTTQVTTTKLARTQSFGNFNKNDNSKVVDTSDIPNAKIFASPLTKSGGDSSIVRIKDGNTLYIVEAPCEGNRQHVKKESIDALSIAAGIHKSNGNTIAVFEGADVPIGTATEIKIPDDAKFEATPVCVIQISSNNNNNGYFNAFMTAISTTSVTVKIVPADNGSSGSSKDPESVSVMCVNKKDDAVTFGGSSSSDPTTSTEGSTATTVTTETKLDDVTLYTVTANTLSSENVNAKSTVSSSQNSGIASILKTSDTSEPEAVHLRRATGAGYRIHMEEDHCGGERANQRGHKAVEQINAILW